MRSAKRPHRPEAEFFADPTDVWELLHDEGYERLPTRPPDQRGSPRREHPPRTRRITWPPQPLRLPSDFAGLLLLVPGLVALDLPGAVSAAHFPGTPRGPRHL